MTIGGTLDAGEDVYIRTCIVIVTLTLRKNNSIDFILIDEQLLVALQKTCTSYHFSSK
jgi:hypothetical protein